MLTRKTKIPILFSLTENNAVHVNGYFNSSLHANHNVLTVLCFFESQGTDAFSQSGLYSNHQDIGPRYAVISCFLYHKICPHEEAIASC
jgi:hypothetical protein